MKTANRKEWSVDGRPASAGQVRLAVFQRDRQCLAAKSDRSHVCTDTWNTIHRPDDWTKLTLEHVPSVHGPEDVRRNDPEHCVTLCSGVNVGVPSKALRAFCREWLVARYPICRATL